MFYGTYIMGWESSKVVKKISFERKKSISCIFFAPKKHAPPFLKMFAERLGEFVAGLTSLMFILHDI